MAKQVIHHDDPGPLGAHYHFSSSRENTHRQLARPNQCSASIDIRPQCWIQRQLQSAPRRFLCFNDRPKRLCIRDLSAGSRRQLHSVEWPLDCHKSLVAGSSRQMPLNQKQMDSLFSVFLQAPDPRGSNTVYRTGPVLTLIAMALLAGRLCGDN